jgi:hypothetical protein
MTKSELSTIIWALFSTVCRLLIAADAQQRAHFDDECSANVTPLTNGCG